MNFLESPCISLNLLDPSSVSLFSPCTDGLERRSIPHEDGTLHSNIKQLNSTSRKHRFRCSAVLSHMFILHECTHFLLPRNEPLAGSTWSSTYETGLVRHCEDSSRLEWSGTWHDLYDLASVAPAPWLSRYFSTSSCRKVTVAQNCTTMHDRSYDLQRGNDSSGAGSAFVALTQQIFVNRTGQQQIRWQFAIDLRNASKRNAPSFRKSRARFLITSVETWLVHWLNWLHQDMESTWINSSKTPLASSPLARRLRTDLPHDQLQIV